MMMMRTIPMMLDIVDGNTRRARIGVAALEEAGQGQGMFPRKMIWRNWTRKLTNRRLRNENGAKEEGEVEEQEQETEEVEVGEAEREFRPPPTRHHYLRCFQPRRRPAFSPDPIDSAQ